jgi:hypothetical protein
MTKPEILDEPADFSLVHGGPLFRLYRRAHLSGDALDLVGRRVVLISLVAWLPLLVLSLIGGHALGGTIKIPFLYDIEAHVRFLIALPLLIIAEVIVHDRIRPKVERFVERRIIVPADLPKFHAAIASAMRVRNSLAAEAVLLVLVYTLGLWIWRSQIATHAATWYATPDGSHLNLTLAGYWCAFVSVPIFQFILVRWYLAFFIWSRFLWQVSRLKLHLIATHPDRAGGIGFMGKSTYAFGPILFAQGTLLAGVIASRIFYEGQNLTAFKLEAAGFVALFVVIVVSPLVVFTPHLMRAKRKGLREYGGLATRYVREFEEKWAGGGTPGSDELLGSPDIQSLADLGNSYAVVQQMRLVPFQLRDVARLGVAAAAPLLPLGLTIFSLEELVIRLVKILF